MRSKIKTLEDLIYNAEGLCKEWAALSKYSPESLAEDADNALEVLDALETAASDYDCLAEAANAVLLAFQEMSEKITDLIRETGES